MRLIRTACLLCSNGLGTGKPVSWSAFMKAYSLAAARRDRYSQLHSSQVLIGHHAMLHRLLEWAY